jgi:hypothetical protein
LSAIYRHRRTGWVNAALALRALAAVLAFAVLPAAAQGRFDIRSAYVERVDGVYQLTTTLDFDLPEGARAAVREGVTLTLDLQIVVRRSRRYWLDEAVATLEQHYEVVHHALSGRYLVRNVNSGEQASFATLDEALNSLRVLSGLPILDQSLVVPDSRHEINLRAGLDVRTMPDALRFVLFWADDWRQRSDWYAWSPQL